MKIHSSNLISQGEKTPEMLRARRKALLKAFDIYKTNISYGVISETEEEHDVISAWYQDILDLREEAIKNPPDELKRYL